MSTEAAPEFVLFCFEDLFYDKRKFTEETPESGDDESPSLPASPASTFITHEEVM